MLALIRKEWRENRALILGFVVLAPIASLAIKQFLMGWKETMPEHSLEAVLPGLVGLYLLAVAADLVAGDASSGRVALVAGLPVRPITQWAAKAAFLYGSAALYAIYVWLMENGILALAGKPAVPTADTSHLLVLGLAVLVGTGTLFYSTLLGRGIAAAFAAVVTVGAVAGLLILVDRPALGFGKKAVAPFVFAGGLLIAGFFVGSASAFARGRVWLEGRVRRLAIGAAVLLGLLLLPAGGMGAAIASWHGFGPDAADLRVGARTRVDRFGRWAFVHAARSGRGPLGVEARYRSWAVRLSDGAVREFGGSMEKDFRFWSEAPEETFPAADHVVLCRWTDAVGLREEHDLDRGEIVSRERAEWSYVRVVGPHRFRWLSDHYRLERADGSGLDLEPDCYPGGGYAAWGFVTCRPGTTRDYRLVRVESGESSLLPSPPDFRYWSYLLLPPEPGGPILGFHSSGNLGSRVLHVYVVPADGTEPRPLGRYRSSPGYYAEPQGRSFAAVLDGHLRGFEAGETEPRDLGRLDGKFAWTDAWAPDGRRFVFATGGKLWLADLDTESVAPVLDLPEPDARPDWFDGERIVLTGDRLWTATTAGDLRRVLPREEE